MGRYWAEDRSRDRAVAVEVGHIAGDQGHSQPPGLAAEGSLGLWSLLVPLDSRVGGPAGGTSVLQYQGVAAVGPCGGVAAVDDTARPYRGAGSGCQDGCPTAEQDDRRAGYHQGPWWQVHGRSPLWQCASPMRAVVGTR